MRKYSLKQNTNSSEIDRNQKIPNGSSKHGRAGRAALSLRLWRAVFVLSCIQYINNLASKEWLICQVFCRFITKAWGFDINKPAEAEIEFLRSG